MRKLLRTYLAAFLAVYFYGNYGLGLEVSQGLPGTSFAALLLGIILLVKPFLDTILFPVNLLTLNLTGLAVFMVLIFLWALITPEVKILAVNFSGGNIGPLELDPVKLPYWLSVILVTFCLVLLLKLLHWLFK